MYKDFRNASSIPPAAGPAFSPSGLHSYNDMLIARAGFHSKHTHRVGKPYRTIFSCSQAATAALFGAGGRTGASMLGFGINGS